MCIDFNMHFSDRFYSWNKHFNLAITKRKEGSQMSKQFDDLSGREFGIYKVIKFSHMAHNGKNGKHYMSYYECECKLCGKRFKVARSELIQSKCSKHLGECKQERGE